MTAQCTTASQYLSQNCLCAVVLRARADRGREFREHSWSREIWQDRSFGKTCASSSAGASRLPHTVGIVPPSMTYSVPLIEDAWGDTRNRIRLATSWGFAGRPSGMPPMLFMMICLPPS